MYSMNAGDDTMWVRLVDICKSLMCRHSDSSSIPCRYDGYDDAYGKASSSMTEADDHSDSGGSPTGNRKERRIGNRRHRDAWNQQIKESNEKTKAHIKSGFKVSVESLFKRLNVACYCKSITATCHNQVLLVYVPCVRTAL